MQPRTFFVIVHRKPVCRDCCTKGDRRDFLVVFFQHHKGPFVVLIDGSDSETEGHTMSFLAVNVDTLEKHVLYHGLIETVEHQAETGKIARHIQAVADSENVPIYFKVGDRSAENTLGVDFQDAFLTAALPMNHLLKGKQNEPTYLNFGDPMNPDAVSLSAETKDRLLERWPMLEVKGLTNKDYRLIGDAYVYLLELCDIELNGKLVPTKEYKPVAEFLDSLIKVCELFDSTTVVDQTNVTVLSAAIAHVRPHILFDRWASVMVSEYEKIVERVAGGLKVPGILYSVAILEKELKIYASDRLRYNLEEIMLQNPWVSSHFGEVQTESRHNCPKCPLKFDTLKQLEAHKKVCEYFVKANESVYTEVPIGVAKDHLSKYLGQTVTKIETLPLGIQRLGVIKLY